MKTKLAESPSQVLPSCARQSRRLSFFYASAQKKPIGKVMSDIRLMTLDPGHFHAGLVQKEMYPGVSPRVDVYAPLGSDLDEHLKRVAAFNAARRTRPPGTSRCTRRPTSSSACCASGRATSSSSPAATAPRSTASSSVEAGLHVLADKPWILEAADLPKLGRTLHEATASVVAYDIMTERFEITSILQRALVNDPAVFGEMQGTEAEPGVYMESVHHLMKWWPARRTSGRRGSSTSAAGRGAERRRHAPGGSGAVDAVSGTGDRLPGRHRGALGAALADEDSEGRVSAA